MHGIDYDLQHRRHSSAGRVLAGRLTDDAQAQFLLVEAGPPDTLRETGADNPNRE